jgi:putative acyl-CoA dehydrogenase
MQTPRAPLTELPTHDVTNQPPPLVDFNAFSLDAALVEGLRREGAAWAHARVEDFGAEVGSAELQEAADLANRYPPQLRTFDQYGQRIDHVEFHPAYHRLMRAGLESGMHAIAWLDGATGGHVAHAALMYLLVQCEPGVCCPITMTGAAIPLLRRDAALTGQWLPKTLCARYDPRALPAGEKTALTIGMAMTEKQGGSDLRTNTTRALVQNDGSYRLTGHKWFCSAPMSDAFFTLAQTASGPTCLLVPRWRPDGTRNAFFIQRLKDKLGDRSNASAEIEFLDTFATRLGNEGDGVRTLIEMVHQTRLDTCIAAAGLMRQAFVQAAHHCTHRHAFGRRLLDQPVMTSVLADLAIEAEAALLLALRIARACDEAGRSDEHAALARVLVAIGKYWTNRRAPQQIAEALECLGGAGYIEESPLPRLYREAPLNGIWEGSGNVICLDVLRALRREPLAAAGLHRLLAQAGAADTRIARRVDALSRMLTDRALAEGQARILTESLAIVLQAQLLVAHAPPAVADAFVETRVEHRSGFAYGTLPARVDCSRIIARAWPPAA